MHLQYDFSPERLYLLSCLQFAIGEPACHYWTHTIAEFIVKACVVAFASSLTEAEIELFAIYLRTVFVCKTDRRTVWYIFEVGIRSNVLPLIATITIGLTETTCTVVKHYETRLFVLHSKIHIQFVLLVSCTIGKQISTLSDHDTVSCQWNASNYQVVGSTSLKAKSFALCNSILSSNLGDIHDVLYLTGWEASPWLMACSHSNAAWASSLSVYRWKDWCGLIAGCQCKLAPIS